MEARGRTWIVHEGGRNVAHSHIKKRVDGAPPFFNEQQAPMAKNQGLICV